MVCCVHRVRANDRDAVPASKTSYSPSVGTPVDSSSSLLAVHLSFHVLNHFFILICSVSCFHLYLQSRPLMFIFRLFLHVYLFDSIRDTWSPGTLKSIQVTAHYVWRFVLSQHLRLLTPSASSKPCTMFACQIPVCFFGALAPLSVCVAGSHCQKRICKILSSVMVEMAPSS